MVRLSQKQTKKKKKAGDMTQVVEQLPSKCRCKPKFKSQYQERKKKKERKKRIFPFRILTIKIILPHKGH
jgi:hypothetical protein